MLVKIIRVEKSTDGVFGVLTIDGQFICLTLERPWLDNQKNISCIPPQIYLCKRVDSPKYKDTFEVLNVAGRTNILFHAGNTIDDSKGCILLGSEIGNIDGKRAVLQSGKAFKSFMEKTEELEAFPFQIINL